MKKVSIQKIINDFKNLGEAIIDASSIIYLNKVKLLRKVITNVKLYTVKKVIDEIGFFPSKMNILEVEERENLSTDNLLIKVCGNYQIAVISDDYKILKEISNIDLPFFNSAMIVCFLFYKKQISNKEFFSSMDKLKEIAYYSDFVWEYVKKVYLELVKNK